MFSGISIGSEIVFSSIGTEMISSSLLTYGLMLYAKGQIQNEEIKRRRKNIKKYFTINSAFNN